MPKDINDLRYLESLTDEELQTLDAVLQTERTLDETRIDHIQNLYESNIPTQILENVLEIKDMHQK